MVERYCSDTRTIILCVVPANADMTCSEGIRTARRLDPKGIRTVGVITKIDLMDEGTDCLEILQGSIYPLKLGYYGVKCRSQMNIN